MQWVLASYVVVTRLGIYVWMYVDGWWMLSCAYGAKCCSLRLALCHDVCESWGSLHLLSFVCLFFLSLFSLIKNDIYS